MVCGIMDDKLPICAIVVTQNEERNISRCLAALGDFSRVIVVDSHSTDRTCAIARDYGAQVVSFRWNGRYPKKRQWSLDTLALTQDWVLWVDADEVVTPELVVDLRRVFAKAPEEAGFFVPGKYVWDGQVLYHGMRNNKLCLFDRRKMAFPVVDDLDVEGMGEIEGHYQPVLKAGHEGASIGQIRAPLIHYAYEDAQGWEARHRRYACWEVDMTRKDAWPRDPVAWREQAKVFLRGFALRGWVMFLYSYVWKCGFLDGRAGFDFAMSRKRYCDMIRAVMREGG